MLILNFIILVIFLIGYLLSLPGSKDWLKEIDKKEHKLYLFYPMADVILRKLRLEKHLYKKEKVTKSIKALYITNNPKLVQKLYWCNRISLIFFVVFLVNLLSLFSQLGQSGSALLKEGKYLSRPKAGEGNKEVELKVTLNNQNPSKDATSSKENASQDMKVQVEEQAYTKEEISSLMEQSIQFLKTDVLGNNKAAEQITQDLNFVSRIPGTAITVEWKPIDYNLVQSDGTVLNSAVSKEGVDTSVTATLTCQNQSKELNLTFHILPRIENANENVTQQLEQEIAKYSKRSAKEPYLELPDRLGDYSLEWQGEKENSSRTIVILGLCTAFLLWIMGEKELENQMKKRKEQLLLDYPELINKFTLLVNAGMTMKQAWYKIAEDYSNKSSQMKFTKHYAYEEMLVTAHELSLGVPENNAYEQYGRRVGLIPYIKFSSLIAQNLKKGNKGVTELLMKEAVDAFEDRKEMAKRLGEEAGTKLLLPMLIMLIIVFMIILIPAFWSFQM